MLTNIYVKVLQNVLRQQSKTISSFNEILGCPRPDKFKVAWDARQAEIAAGADPSSLPPLKQI